MSDLDEKKKKQEEETSFVRRAPFLSSSLFLLLLPPPPSPNIYIYIYIYIYIKKTDQVDVLLAPLEVLQVLDPLEKRNRDAAAVGVDVGQDGHAAVAEDAVAWFLSWFPLV